MSQTPLSPAELDSLDAAWRAANYLAVGQIYLLDNPLLRGGLQPQELKPRLLGHWGTTPGLNFICAHLNRVIKRDDLDMIYVCGPGHGGPAMVASTYLEGSYSERYPNVSLDEDGMRWLFRQFSFPGGIPSHVAPETPRSIHEGGELGYALAHAYGAAFDNPELIVACVVGDGEAETGPLATAWHSNKFLNPVTDGAVLPVLHLNGYKISNPTILARIPRDELDQLLAGYGYTPHWVEGSEPAAMHQQMAAALDTVLAEIRAIQREARATGTATRPRWPMIVLKTLKGWTGPKEVDGQRTEGSWRSHQVPLADFARHPAHLQNLEAEPGGLDAELSARGAVRRTGDAAPGRDGAGAGRAAPHGRESSCQRGAPSQGPEDARLPDLRRRRAHAGYRDGRGDPRPRRIPPDVMRLNEGSRNFRGFGPDETASNRLSALFEATDRTWVAERQPDDDHLAPAGRVMEILSEHTCQGWLEGYLLTGRQDCSRATRRLSTSSTRCSAARAPADTQGSGGQRGGPDATPAGRGASTRPVERGVRFPVHHGQADHPRVSRIPLGHSPADLPADEPPESPRPRL